DLVETLSCRAHNFRRGQSQAHRSGDERERRRQIFDDADQVQLAARDGAREVCTYAHDFAFVGGIGDGGENDESGIRRGSGHGNHSHLRRPCRRRHMGCISESLAAAGHGRRCSGRLPKRAILAPMSFHPAKRLPAWRKLALETWRMPSSPAAYGALDLDCEAALAWCARAREASGEKVTLTHLVGKEAGG